MLVVNQNNRRVIRIPNNVVYSGSEFVADFGGFGSAKDNFVGKRKYVVWKGTGGAGATTSAFYAKTAGYPFWSGGGETNSWPAEFLTPEPVNNNYQFLVTGNVYGGHPQEEGRPPVENHGYPSIGGSNFYGTNEQKLFGKNVAKSLPGSIVFSAPAAMQLGANNWTFEFWYMPLGATATIPQLCFNKAIGNTAPFVINNSGLWYLSNSANNNWANNFTIGGAASPGVWTHYALTRTNNTGSNVAQLRAFKNGVMVAGPVNWAGATASTAHATQDGFTIGAYNTPISGYWADVALTVGTSKYTANFTPPTTRIIP